jgi:signal transduction histidine kinase
MPRRPPPLDIALVAGLAVWAVVEALLLAGDGSRPVRVLWALGFTLPLLVRRSAPVPVAALVAAVVTARILIDHGGTGEEGAMPFPALLCASYSGAVHARSLRLAIAAGVVAYVPLLLAILFSYFEGSGEPSDAIILSFFAGAAWSAGYFVRRRGEHAVVESLEAVAAERARIARELHDIIGHSMSVIALQAGAAEQVLRRDPDAAREHLRAVQRTTRSALTEMRRLMGVLREDEAAYAPQPGLANLDALAQEAGLAVEVVVEGTRGEIPPSIDLAAYRIVQEALTNARKHAGAVRAHVAVRYGEGEVELRVSNPPGPRPVLNGDSGGLGLAGMRERVRLFGGSVDAGPSGDGGFAVRARLPLEAPE